MNVFKTLKEDTLTRNKMINESIKVNKRSSDSKNN